MIKMRNLLNESHINISDIVTFDLLDTPMSYFRGNFQTKQEIKRHHNMKATVIKSIGQNLFTIRFDDGFILKDVAKAHLK